MKKAFILVVLLALSFSTGCKKQLYHFVGNVPITKEYFPNSGTSFSGTDIITKEDVTDVLNLPNNAQIDKVDLQNTGVVVEPFEDNRATKVRLNGTVAIGLGAPLPLINNIDVSTDSTYTLALMDSAGVRALTNQINAFLLPFPSTTSITIALRGESIPVGSLAHVKVTLKFQCNVPSEACIEFPSFISEGEDCTITE